VLRAHVDDDPLLVERGRLVDEVVPVTAGDVEDRCAVEPFVDGGPVGVAERLVGALASKTSVSWSWVVIS
jgi:hypothetical protein